MPKPKGKGFLGWLGRQVGHVKKAVRTDVTAPAAPPPKKVYENKTVEETAHPENPNIKLRRTTIDEAIVDDDKRVDGPVRFLAHEDAMLDPLKSIAEIDPQRVEQARNWLTSATRYAVRAAKAFWVLAVVSLILSAITVVLLLAYFIAYRRQTGWPWILIAVAAIPLIASILFTWQLRLAMRAPETISKMSGQLTEAIKRFQGDKPAEMPDENARPTWRQRITGLIRYGRLALDLRTTAGGSLDAPALKPLRAAAMMATPVFWVVLLITVIVSMVFAIAAPVVCLVHYFVA